MMPTFLHAVLPAVAFAGLSLASGVGFAEENPPPAIAERLPGYALVGTFDFDKDGQNDRGTLREMLVTAGSAIVHEVDDQGIRKPAGGKINSRTKMLLVGEIPDPKTIKDPKGRRIAEKMQSHYEDMQAEATRAGVRVVTFDDFFRFGGPKRRPNNGQTSRIYSGSKRLKQPVGTGQTSGIYRRSKESVEKDGNR